MNPVIEIRRKAYNDAIRATGRLDVLLRHSRRCLEVRYDADKLLKEIDGGHNGTSKEFRSVVVPYWKQYKIVPEKRWYDLYCSDLEEYNPRFIPDTIWFSKILPYFNNVPIAKAYNDKCMTDVFVKDVKMPYSHRDIVVPHTVVKNIAGYYYDDCGNAISRKEAERICRSEEYLIVKPAFGSQGKGITFFDNPSFDNSISDTFDKYRSSFVVQRVVKQHHELERLNKTSLNTVRVLSFHFKGRVHVLSAQLRIGGDGARVDNYSAGGSACTVNPDGWLKETAIIKKRGWVDCLDSGIKFRDIRVPNYEGILESVKELHSHLPYFNIVGWDFGVDEDGRPVLIEFNTGPGQNQLGDRKPTFGAITDEVLEDVFINKTLKGMFGA